MAVVGSVLYIVSFITVAVMFILAPKSGREQSIIVWLPVTFIVIITYDALLAALIGLVHIPINLYSTACMNLLACLFLAWYMRRKGTRQRYRVVPADVVALVLCLLLAVACGYLQFGSGLDIRYITSDPAVHFQAAMKIVDGGTVTSMYLAWYFIAMCIESVAPLVPVILYYKVFIICDVFFLFLGAMLLYAVIARSDGRIRYSIAAVSLILLYLVGYPLTGMLFGFCYLGLGVSAAALVLFVASLMDRDDSLDGRWAEALLMLGMFAVFISYSLFVPVVYLGAFLFLIHRFQAEGKLFSRVHVLKMMFIFLPPLVLGCYYAIISVFVAVTPSAAIAQEGFNYRDLYSNFVIVAPLVFYQLFRSIKDRSWEPDTIFMTVCLVIMVLSFLAACFGVISTYYLSKFYFLMWLLAYACAAQGIAKLLDGDGRLFLYSYCVVWLCIMLAAISGFGQRLYDRDPNLDPYPLKSWSYLDLYQFNLTELKQASRYDQAKLDLYEDAYQISAETGTTVPIVGGVTDFFWYAPITGQMVLAQYNPWTEGEHTEYDGSYGALLSRSDYVLVLTEPSIGAYAPPAFIDGSQKVAENTAGYIAKVSNR